MNVLFFVSSLQVSTVSKWKGNARQLSHRSTTRGETLLTKVVWSHCEPTGGKEASPIDVERASLQIWFGLRLPTDG